MRRLLIPTISLLLVGCGGSESTSTPTAAEPGHTAGHQSVLVMPSEGPRVLIAGDAVYSEAALVTRTIDGVDVDPDRARASIDRLREICRDAPTVVAPTHDTGAARRVATGQVTAL
jgi:glyoxylase-like metal-dependent hydrolase (beta-lactamase superfamily II)